MAFYTDVKRYGNNILYRGYESDGTPIAKKIKFKPDLFIPYDEKSRIPPSNWKTLHGVKIEPVRMESMRDAKEFIQTYDGVDNFRIQGNTNYISQWMQRTWPDDIQYNSKFIRVANFDIEVASADGFPIPEEANYPVISIALKCSHSNVYYVWGMDNYDTLNTGLDLDGALIQYFKCKDEDELLRKFVHRWDSLAPDVATGWYIRFFDIPYLINRILKVCGEDVAKQLSPWKQINYRQINVKGKSLDTYEIYGIQQMDYKDLFDKFGYFSYGNQESYTLDHIAHTVLGERKLSYEEHGSLHTLYKNDYQKFISYNIKDVQLVDKIDKQTNMMDLAFTMAYKAGVNYNDVLGTTAIWDSFINRYLYERKIVPPPNTNNPKVSYPGGYVKDPKIGLSEWVVSFDLASLYPSIIVQNNMSPETIIDGDVDYPNGVDHYMDNPPSTKQSGCSVAANGVKFKTDERGMLPNIIVSLYDERRLIKDRMLEVDQERENESGSSKHRLKELDRERIILHNQQMAIKIFMNSLYGALGNAWFRYYDLRVAEGITLSGQLSIRWAERAVNEYMNKLLETESEDYIIAIDTDSIYVNMKGVVDKFSPTNPVQFLDKVCSGKIEPMIAKAYANLYEQMGGNENRMDMEREVIADRGIWTAKKRYILNVHNSEGVQYAKPKMKMMGVEAVKSSTPQVVRDKFKEAFEIILNGNEIDIQKFVSKFYDEFCKLPAETVSSPRGITNIDKWVEPLRGYKKGTPIHVRGGILYNKKLKELNMNNVVEDIKNGTKIKYCYLKMPNPLHENVISFPQFLPREFELNDYVDYDIQFEKSFKEPLAVVTNAVGWQLEKLATLDSFFG